MPKKLSSEKTPESRRVLHRLGLPTNGYGYIQRAADIMDGSLLWHPAEYWLQWDGRYYQSLMGETPAEVLDLLDKGFHEELGKAASIFDEKEMEKHRKFLLGPLGSLPAATALLKNLRKVPQFIYDFRMPPPAHMLPVPNGTINLRTGALGPHEREHRFTAASPVPYDADAECPRFLQFMEEFTDGDSELADYLLSVMAYTITGEIQGEQCWYLCGQGRNGKTTFLNTMQRLLGNFYGHFPGSLVVQSSRGGGTSADGYDLARIPGLRMAVAGEVAPNTRWNEEWVKNLCSNSDVNARQIYGKPFSFTPTHALWMFGNHKPTTRGASLGFWRRFRFIPCNHSVPDDKLDYHLEDKLVAELPGILNLLVTKAVEFYAAGCLPDLPAAIQREQTTYAEQSDILLTFLRDTTVEEPGAVVSVTDLADLFEEWQNDFVGESDSALGPRMLSSWLVERGFKRVKRRPKKNDNPKWCFLNIRLKTPQEHDDDHQ